MVTWCNEFHHGASFSHTFLSQRRAVLVSNQGPVTWSTTRDCNTIASQYGISLAAFIRWNPDVGSDCGQLLLDYWYCVGRVSP
jgi:hypothetical protein